MLFPFDKYRIDLKCWRNHIHMNFRDEMDRERELKGLFLTENYEKEKFEN